MNSVPFDVQGAMMVLEFTVEGVIEGTIIFSRDNDGNIGIPNEDAFSGGTPLEITSLYTDHFEAPMRAQEFATRKAPDDEKHMAAWVEDDYVYVCIASDGFSAQRAAKRYGELHLAHLVKHSQTED